MTAATLTVYPGDVRGGHVAVPGDKSISHRALILSALAEGDTVIHGLLESADCLATAAALRQMGVPISRTTNKEVSFSVSGCGLHGLQEPGREIDCGNSGTTMRLLAGVLAGQTFETVLIGDESLSRRPMRRVAEPLTQMGAIVETASAGTPPLHIRGQRPLHAIDYALPLPSAQVKSAILLAGLFAESETRVIEPGVSRDHTEQMLAAFGVPLRRDGETITVPPVARLVSPGAIDVPGDLSSAAFLLVLGAIAPDCRIELERVGVNPTRDGVLQLLQRMGARLEIRDRRKTRGGEPVADLVIESSNLRGIEVDAADVALAIDEVPILMIAAACAEGTTRVRGAGELRLKESDRLQAMAAGLRALGIAVDEFEDGLAVTGGRLQSGTVDSGGDHRIAMAFAVAGAAAAGPVKVFNTQNIATSWPAFATTARGLGLSIETGRE